LATLSSSGGFRRYIRAQAINHGLTGTIQRTEGSDVRVIFEGDITQHNNFYDFLMELVGLTMIDDIDFVVERAIRRRAKAGFKILHDGSHKKSARNPDGVVSGRYSGNDYEIASSVGSL